MHGDKISWPYPPESYIISKYISLFVSLEMLQKQRCFREGKKKSGPWFNIKMSSYQHRKSNCGDKTILRPSYLHNGISYTGKKTSFYWIGPCPLASPFLHVSKALAGCIIWVQCCQWSWLNGWYVISSLPWSQLLLQAGTIDVISRQGADNTWGLQRNGWHFADIFKWIFFKEYHIFIWSFFWDIQLTMSQHWFR